MVPVRVNNLPRVVQQPPYGDEWEPDRVALYKDIFACTVSRSGFREDLQEQIKIMKKRDGDLKHLINRASGQSDTDTRGGADGAAMEFGDMKTLNSELKNLRDQKEREIERLEADRTHHKKELERIARELTICDQQDTALNEFSAQLEMKRSDSTGGFKNRGLDTQLNDISHFKASNKRSLMNFNEQRERMEEQLMIITKDLATSIAERQQLEAREKLIKTLWSGNMGGSDASEDNGLRIAVSKRHELAATDPATLSSVGGFVGFREVLATSDRALSDISSALKEVSAASSGGDGVLESVLEANLKLRKDANSQIREKLQSAEVKLGNTDRWDYKDMSFFTETSKNPIQKGVSGRLTPQLGPQAHAALGWMGGGFKALGGGSGAGTPKR